MTNNLYWFFFTFQYVLKELFVPTLPVKDEKDCKLSTIIIEQSEIPSFRSLTKNKPAKGSAQVFSSLWRRVEPRPKTTFSSSKAEAETNLLTKALYVSPIPINLVDGQKHTVFCIDLYNSNSGIDLKVWRYLSDYMFSYEKNPFLRKGEEKVLSVEDMEVISNYNENNILPDYFTASISNYNFAAIDFKVKDFVGYSSWIHLLINFLDIRAKTSYEGSRYPFACVIQKKPYETTDKPKLIDFLREDASFLFSDGVCSWHNVSCNGYIVNYVDLSDSSQSLLPEKDTSSPKKYAPYEYEGFASACTNDAIGIILRASGEILVFYRGELKLSKKSNYWVPYDSSTFIDLLLKKLNLPSAQVKREIAESIYETILDVSFGTGGGCIGIMDKDTFTKRYKEGADPENHVVKQFLSTYIGTRFDSIPRHIRHQLLSIDGSTIISKQGLLLCAGKILSNITPCPGKGARYAAAKALGQQPEDLGIKMSEDGGAIAFSNNSIVLQIF